MARSASSAVCVTMFDRAAPNATSSARANFSSTRIRFEMTPWMPENSPRALASRIARVPGMWPSSAASSSSIVCRRASAPASSWRRGAIGGLRVGQRLRGGGDARVGASRRLLRGCEARFQVGEFDPRAFLRLHVAGDEFALGLRVFVQSERFALEPLVFGLRRLQLRAPFGVAGRGARGSGLDFAQGRVQTVESDARRSDRLLRQRLAPALRFEFVGVRSEFRFEPFDRRPQRRTLGFGALAVVGDLRRLRLERFAPRAERGKLRFALGQFAARLRRFRAQRLESALALIELRAQRGQLRFDRRRPAAAPRARLPAVRVRLATVHARCGAKPWRADTREFRDRGRARRRAR